MYRCSFDAKVDRQDVRIRARLVQFGEGGLLTGLRRFVLIGSGMMTFSKLVNTFQRHYGAPGPPPSTDALELIIWENIVYLASDERRAEAFAALKRDIGTRPEQILAAKHAALAAIGEAGILPDMSAEKLLAIAKIAFEEFDSDLRSVLKKPLPQAKKALKRFPSIGDPAAGKILLFTRSHPYSHSTPMACECYVESISPKSRRTIQRLTVWFRVRYVSNCPETTIR